MLLQHGLLPEPEQRLTGITLLYELYKGEPLANTPFASVFMHLLVSTYIISNIEMVHFQKIAAPTGATK